MEARRRAFVGLGSNLGDRHAYLRAAVEGLRQGGDVVAVSPLYETEPVGGPADQGAYLNAVVELSTETRPEPSSGDARPSNRRRGACAPSAGGRGPSMPTFSTSRGARSTSPI